MSHVNRGETGDALAVTMHSIEIRETPENGSCWRVSSAGFRSTATRTAAPFLPRALEEGWTAPASFAPAASR